METLYELLARLYTTYMDPVICYSVEIALHWVCLLFLLVIIFMPVLCMMVVWRIARKIGSRNGGGYDV